MSELDTDFTHQKVNRFIVDLGKETGTRSYGVVLGEMLKVFFKLDAGERERERGGVYLTF